MRTVARWWLSVYKPGHLPSRREIDLNPIRHALPYVWLVEHLPEDDDFRYRLAGENINYVFGFSLRGKRLGEIVEPHMIETVRARFLYVLNTPGVSHATGRDHVRHGVYREAERLILPLADHGLKATHLFGVTDYGMGRNDGGQKPPEFMKESFLKISDVLPWRTALAVPRRRR